MKLYSVHWKQNTKSYCSLNFPPYPHVLGYWKVGESFDGTHIMKAYVTSNNKEECVLNMLTDWPEINIDQIIEIRSIDYIAEENLFYQVDWMISRLNDYIKRKI